MPDDDIQEVLRRELGCHPQSSPYYSINSLGNMVATNSANQVAVTSNLQTEVTNLRGKVDELGRIVLALQDELERLKSLPRSLDRRDVEDWLDA